MRRVATYGVRKLIEYSEERWKILKEKRERAKEIMDSLFSFGIESIVYGSVARGDVTEKSDVDIFIPHNIPSYKVEIALDGFEVLEKRIIQATPNYAIKGEYVLSDNTTVSFPLVRMREREMDFYRFGGCIDYNGIVEDRRVAGVDKRLVLIIPNEKGHREVPLTDMHPSSVARMLDVSIDIVMERIRVLTRRREVGRTGIFLCETIALNECFESALKSIASRNPAVRRRID
ncbi:nucleotidyltransferase domain-containing protein [Archaeoglobus neptunius]|uniref:nucleotidyltransferase domain-containing protein n=1 Tax=Archaeoglobus neptunius TaxID=2798580 RepID=UPI001925C4FB|nr:nucleotidyltransferase domain-containing protein [Archaeoglobus neptunius]